MADVTSLPLERLNRLAQDLAKEALRSDVTGQDGIPVGHEWAEDLLDVNAALQRDAKQPAFSWAATPWPTKGLIVAICALASTVILSLCWVAASWAWSTAQDFQDEGAPAPAGLMFGPIDGHVLWAEEGDCQDWAEATFPDPDPAFDCAPTA